MYKQNFRALHKLKSISINKQLWHRSVFPLHDRLPQFVKASWSFDMPLEHNPSCVGTLGRHTWKRHFTETCSRDKITTFTQTIQWSEGWLQWHVHSSVLILFRDVQGVILSLLYFTVTQSLMCSDSVLGKCRASMCPQHFVVSRSCDVVPPYISLRQEPNFKIENFLGIWQWTIAQMRKQEEL